MRKEWTRLAHIPVLSRAVEIIDSLRAALACACAQNRLIQRLNSEQESTALSEVSSDLWLQVESEVLLAKMNRSSPGELKVMASQELVSVSVTEQEG